MTSEGELPAAEKGQENTVFVSYAREDSDAAKKLYNDLKGAGLNPWLDKECLIAGQNWKLSIKNAIKKSRYFIPLFSSTSVEKRGYIQKEFKYALEVFDEFPESQIFVIPVKLDECEIPYDTLKDIEYVDLFPQWEDGVRRILQAMNIEQHSPYNKADDKSKNQSKNSLNDNYTVKTLDIPILVNAIDFLFEEGKRILLERKELRKNDAGTARSETEIINEPHDTDVTGHLIDSKEQLLKQQLLLRNWNNSESKVEQLMRLIKIYTRNYDLAKQQSAQWGSALVPPIVVNSLQEAEDSIFDTVTKLTAVLTDVFGGEIVIEGL